jgi:hypothetical protein
MKQLTGFVCVFFVLVSCSKPDTVQDKKACHDNLKASFTEVWNGRPDPLKGQERPKSCTRLSKDVYDQIFFDVMAEVSETPPTLGK